MPQEVQGCPSRPQEAQVGASGRLDRRLNPKENVVAPQNRWLYSKGPAGSQIGRIPNRGINPEGNVTPQGDSMGT
eukprot:8580990-Pyramimonas_sp.AAC.1